MSDIIERLKYFSGWSTRDVPGIELSPTSNLAWDAIDEIERLRAALRKIANPIGYFQEYAKQEGRQLDGHMAIQISKDPGWLSSEAAKALSAGAVSPPSERGNG